MILQFDSINACVAAYTNYSEAATRLRGHSEDISWHGGETRTMSLRLALAGDTTLVPEAEAIINQLDTVIETPRRVWEPAVAGAFCSVPDYLSGRPTNMRRQLIEIDDHAPIHILVSTTSSAAITAEIMRKRGTVILALVLALNRFRPITLRIVDIGDGIQDGETIVTAQINTAPLELATACYVLTSVGFARRILYGLKQAVNGFTGRWPRGYNFNNPSAYYNSLSSRLGLDPKQTLVIGSARNNDPMLQHPLNWIEQQIKRFTQSEKD
jgi:hypothetical protein